MTNSNLKGCLIAAALGVVAVPVIIFVASWLLLTFVNRGVSNSYSAQCKNNLRNLAMAASAYETRKSRYPGYQQQLGERTIPWTIELFPDVERMDLYEDWRNEMNAAPPRPFMELYVCPHDPPELIGGPANSYVANAGMAGEESQNPANGIFLDLASGRPPLTADSLAAGDARTSTLLVSENVQATTWDIPGKRDTVFVWHPLIAPTDAMRINREMKGPLTDETARPASYHPGGVNVAFADTHVNFLREDIDYKVYMHLMTSNGRKSDIPADWKGYVLREADFR
jgi:prepilin-type processing-associated H-X9-DG protein